MLDERLGIDGHSSLYSAGSSSGHQPSRKVTGTCREPWYCLSCARQLSGLARTGPLVRAAGRLRRWLRPRRPGPLAGLGMALPTGFGLLLLENLRINILGPGSAGR